MKPVQLTLEAARELTRFVNQHRDRIDAERCSLQFKQALQPKTSQHPSDDLPLFGGERQKEIF